MLNAFSLEVLASDRSRSLRDDVHRLRGRSVRSMLAVCLTALAAGSFRLAVALDDEPQGGRSIA